MADALVLIPAVRTRVAGEPVATSTALAAALAVALVAALAAAHAAALAEQPALAVLSVRPHRHRLTATTRTTSFFGVERA